MGKTPISTCQQLTNARTHHHQTPPRRRGPAAPATRTKGWFARAQVCAPTPANPKRIPAQPVPGCPISGLTHPRRADSRKAGRLRGAPKSFSSAPDTATQRYPTHHQRKPAPTTDLQRYGETPQRHIHADPLPTRRTYVAKIAGLRLPTPVVATRSTNSCRLHPPRTVLRTILQSHVDIERRIIFLDSGRLPVPKSSSSLAEHPSNSELHRGSALKSPCLRSNETETNA